MSENSLIEEDTRKINTTSSPGSHKRRTIAVLMLIVGLIIFSGPFLRRAECGENGLTQEDKKFLNMAVELARQSVKAGNHPFGAVVVKDGKVVAKGMNEVLTTKEVFFHAEIVALNAAYQKRGREGVEGATLYTSCEPCPMCTGAAYISGISRVVYAISCEKFGTIIGDDSFCMSARKVLELGKKQTIVQGPFMEDIAARPVYEFLDRWKKNKDGANPNAEKRKVRP